MAVDSGQAFPKSTLESARKAKLTMENFYDHLLIQDRDRTNRWRKLDISMEEMALSTDEVKRKLSISRVYMCLKPGSQCEAQACVASCMI